MVSSPYPSTVSYWLKNPLVKLLLVSLLFIIILYAVKYALNILKPTKGGSAIEAVQEVIKGGGKWIKK
jgi:hypothetical protein